jgi:YHS domain-containing protein/thiol-disulfide isomerase/thioredoxin
MSCRSHVCSLVAALAAVCVPGIVLAAAPTGVNWRDNVDAAKIEAAQSGRLVLLHFYTRTCAPCKALDQNVLSQPHVGLAVEREYVPVKIDADTAPALASMYKIDRVPSEVVLTPQGTFVANLSTPDNPDGYIAQLQNLSRHFRQTTPAGGPTPAVNSAYASLPTRSAIAAPAVVANPVSAPAAAGVPQQQGNPYVAAPPRTQATPQVQQAVPAASLAASAVPSAHGIAANGVPTMPANAMPTSYRNPMFSSPPVAAGAPPVAGMAGVAVAPGVAAPPVTTVATPTAQPANSAYAGLGAAVAAPATQVAPAAQGAPSVGGPVTAAAPATQFAAAAATATVAAPVVRPTQAPLPAGSPPVAFDGCCPVTLKLMNKWEQGSTQFGAIHRGRTYLFAGDEQRKQFLANPDSFSPVFAGYDPVLLLDRQQSVAGSRKFGFRYGDAFYLFSCAETKARFEASPQTYAAGVRQAMARIDGTPGGILRR